MITFNERTRIGKVEAWEILTCRFDCFEMPRKGKEVVHVPARGMGDIETIGKDAFGFYYYNQSNE